jgi:hypothetical protein
MSKYVKNFSKRIRVTGSYCKTDNNGEIRVFDIYCGDRLELEITKDIVRKLKPVGRDELDLGFTLFSENKYEITIKRITEQEYSIDAIIWNECTFHIVISKYDYRELKHMIYTMAKDIYLKSQGI